MGCGVDTYDSRLRQTKDYFEYLEKVNLALSPRSVPFEGVEIRVPKPFVQITPTASGADGQNNEPRLDPDNDPDRLGNHPNVRLEGVLGSWKAKVDLDTPAGAEGTAYLHLLSNLPRWVEKQNNNDIEPQYYRRDLTNVLANAYNVQTETTDSPWPWEMLRGFSPYVGKKKVEVIPIPPEDQPINAVFYWTEINDIHVGLLLIYPRAMDARLKLEDRLKHTLETLKVPSQPPQRKSSRPTVGGF